MPISQPGYPKYQGSEKKSETLNYLQQLGGRRALNGIVDKIYFVFAGLASIWLAVSALIVVAASPSWWVIFLILIVWAIFAYLTLPRFHRMMTTLYVPNYFIGRTQTADGLLGDPINIGFLGESIDIHTAMDRAGWKLAEPVTLASSWRIIVNTLRKRPYPTAPVSPLYLFDRQQDFAYQQEVDGSPEKRHHIRFWKAPEGWKLPGGIDVDWVAAATFDRAVGLSLFTFQITHKIDAETDRERDYVINTIQFCNDYTELRIIEDFSTGYHSRNGGGDAIMTDGNLPILNVHAVVKENLAIPDNSPQSKYSHHRKPWELIESAPLSLWFAGFFVSLVAILQSIMSITHLGTDTSRVTSALIYGIPEKLQATLTESTAQLIYWAVLVVLMLVSLIQVVLAVNVIRGKNRSRKLILVLLSVSFVVTSVHTVLGEVYGGATYAVFILMASHVFALLEFTSDETINYTYRSTLDKKIGPTFRGRLSSKKPG